MSTLDHDALRKLSEEACDLWFEGSKEALQPLLSNFPQATESVKTAFKAGFMRGSAIALVSTKMPQ